MRIRRAGAAEHDALSRIAREAKAHWGYAAVDLARWAADLTVLPDSVTQRPTYVAEVDGEAAGFFQLGFPSGEVEVEHLWVRPSYMRRGIGRALLERAAREAAGLGFARLLIDSDPNAVPFYLACGARRTGEKPAAAAGQADRVRPQLRLALPPPGGPPLPRGRPAR